MGERVGSRSFRREDRAVFREKLKRSRVVLERMLAAGMFESRRKLIGLEIELNLADADGRAVMLNEEVLERIASQDFQTELGRFNLEMNIAPHKLVGLVFSELHEELRTSFLYADRMAAEVGARIVMVGILPTLDEAMMDAANFSSSDRYLLLNDEIFNARGGEELVVSIEGEESLALSAPTILAEAGATSLQLHLQVSPEGFASLWNAAQVAAGPQLAVGANSPFLFGRRLWAETRIALFEQTTDTRTEDLVAQGVRPRVWFGERWIGGPMDLWEENVRYFAPLLPVVDEEDPEEVMERGGVPHLREMRLHNGTVYRWNRPVYDVARGKPHLRVENRVLPAGPTVTDMVANAAFYYGLVRALVEEETPVWMRMAFAQAAENFHRGARYGLDARLYWPGRGRMPADRLVLEELLPRAAAGLDAWGVDPHERDRWLGVVDDRVRTGVTGARWQVRTVEELVGRGLDRATALSRMTRRYAELMRSDEPVHTWPLG